MSPATSKSSDRRIVLSKEILELFQESFPNTFDLGEEELQNRIQKVKSSLFDRDYRGAFGSQDSLDVYAVRWSSSRALAYSEFFSSLPPIKTALARNGCRVLTIGGGAGAEIVAIASVALLGDEKDTSVQVTAVDVAQWDTVVSRIVDYVNNKWYAWHQREPSTAFSVHFINHDILTLPVAELQLESVDLITCMFTTNELFASSKAGTVKFLQSLSSCHATTLLVILESAGSYSEIRVGTKTFPVQFLIQHTLTTNGTWKLLDSDDSRWYRVPDGLKYPLKLENMRFFFRLYERT
jgi:25S rRNA (uracil2843-N3)-methyltransferase